MKASSSCLAVDDLSSSRGRGRENSRDRKSARSFDALDERLVHQVLDHVLPPDVDDERHPRTQGRDVREVLVGADAQIDAVGRGALPQFRNRLLDTSFRWTGNCRSGRSRQARKYPRPASRTRGRSAASAACRRPPGRAGQSATPDRLKTAVATASRCRRVRFMEPRSEQSAQYRLNS